MGYRALHIDKHIIDKEGKPFLIAEIAQAHEGSLNFAHAYIDAVADSGCDAVKFQTHIADAESTLDEPFHLYHSKQDIDRMSYWQRTSFTSEQWAGLAQHARERGLVFLSSAFSRAAVILLDKLDVPAWKLGSGESSIVGIYKTSEVVEAMSKTGKPVIASLGMMSCEAIHNMVSYFDSLALSYALLQCTSCYPTSFERVGLNVIMQMRERYQCPAGLSDHSGTVFPALAALARGAEIIEVHAVFDRRLSGPDASSSLTFEEIRFLCEARDAFRHMDQNPVDKDSLDQEFVRARSTFGKSLALVRDLPAKACITDQDLTDKKPAGGIPLDQRESVIGRQLKRSVSSHRILQWQDIDGE